MTRGWAEPHFTHPRLRAKVRAGSSDAHQATLTLVDGDRQLDISVAGDHASAVALFEALADPCSDEWTAVADQHAPAALQDLVADLDRLGWIVETDSSGMTRERDRLEQLTTLRSDAVAWLDDASSIRRTAPRPSSLATHVLERCRSVWASHAPHVDHEVRFLLDARAPNRSGQAPSAVDDVSDAAARIWTALQLDVLSRCPALDAQHQRFVPRSPVAGPAINVLVLAEHCAEALLAALNSDTANLANTQGITDVARLVYQHRHFETIRYVDAATSLLSRRLHPPLRSRFIEYLTEEFGHEAHELQACHELGVSDSEIARFAPLAWFGAYPDLFAHAARTDPLGFLLSMTVAEGLPGSGRRLSERLLDEGLASPAADAHDRIDIALNHQMVTRSLFATIDWLSSSHARRSIATFLEVVEVTARGWELLGRVAEHFPSTPMAPFAISATQLYELAETLEPPAVL